jgi:hypothetical protein
MTVADRWWDSIVDTAAEAFAQAVERGDVEVAERWAGVVLKHLDDQEVDA